MIPNGSHHAVSNGSQTDVIDAGMRAGKSFDESLMGQRHEPDAPNFTPRISGVTNVEDGSCALSVVARSPVGDTLSEHRHFRFLPEVRRNRPQQSCSGRRDVRVVRTFGSARTCFVAGLCACMRACVLVRLWCVCAIRLCRHMGEGAGKLNADRSFLRGLDTSSRLTCRMAIRSPPSRVPPSWYAPCASSGCPFACERVYLGNSEHWAQSCLPCYAGTAERQRRRDRRCILEHVERR
jgi:hypothetical protein